jgi:hypothetical protein
MIAITVDFIRQGTARKLDSASCLAQVKQKPFLFEMPKEGIALSF